MVSKDLLGGGTIFGTNILNYETPISLNEWEKYI
jgi:hypothetical protein